MLLVFLSFARLIDIPRLAIAFLRTKLFGDDPSTSRLAKLRSSPYFLGEADMFRVDAYCWELMADSAPFAPRDGAGGVVFDNRMFLIAGWNPHDARHFPRTTSNDVWVSGNGRDWDQIKPNTFLDHTFDSANDWEGRHTAGFLVHDNHIWIIGGDANQGWHQGDIWKSRDGIQWKRVAEGNQIPWNPRALHVSFVFRDRMFVMGGQTMPQFLNQGRSLEQRYYNDVWSSFNGRDWIKHESDLPRWSPRGGIGGNPVFRNRIWIVGGFTYEVDVSRRQVFSDIWSSSDGTNWIKETDVAEWAHDQEGLMYHDLMAFDNKLWMVGGFRRPNGNTNEVWYSEDGIQWQRLAFSPLAPTHSTTLFRYQNGLYIVAGNHMNREVWRLTRAPRGGASTE